MKRHEVIKNNMEALVSLSGGAHSSGCKWIRGNISGSLYFDMNKESVRYDDRIKSAVVDATEEGTMSISLSDKCYILIERIQLEDYFYDLRNPTEGEVDLLSITYKNVFEFLMASSLFDSGS